MVRNKMQLDAWVSLIRQVVREEWMPAEEAVEQAGEISDLMHQRMREHGLFRFRLPEEYGGHGCTCEEMALINIEL